jgi:hypothetical protein
MPDYLFTICRRETGAILLTTGTRAAAGADLTCADLRRARLAGWDLRGTNLRRADLRRAVLVDADLRGADLTCANLRLAYLQGANLAGANLQGANLHMADLCEADLRDADLLCANLAGAQLVNLVPRLSAARLEGANLTSAFYDRITRWPPGFDPKERGCILIRPPEIVPAAAPDGRGDEGQPSDRAAGMGQQDDNHSSFRPAGV